MASTKWNLGYAIEWRNEEGKLHREDGPAREYKDGGKEWWFKGLLHRVDGPAIMYANGYKEWSYKGLEFKSEEEWFKALSAEEQLDYIFNIES